MAIIHGQKSTGGNGVLTHTELTDLIYKRSNGRADRTNCGKCATHIEDMTEMSDQGGITTKYAGRSVFHISNGKRGGDDGCTTFFTLSSEGGDGLTAGIVAVGWHAPGKDTVYVLDWGKGPPFFTGNRLDTTKQHQKGYSAGG
jgi:hypothetical protein